MKYYTIFYQICKLLHIIYKNILEVIMANLVNCNNNKKFSFKEKKDNTICSLFQVENFLNVVTACSDTIKLYCICKKFKKYR